MVRQANNDWAHTAAENIVDGMKLATPLKMGEIADLLGTGAKEVAKMAQDSAANPFQPNAYLEDVANEVHKEQVTAMDLARCAKSNELLKRSKKLPLPRRDPLVFALDGDGIETVSASSGVRFDHDGNGIKTGTGWAGDREVFSCSRRYYKGYRPILYTRQGVISHMATSANDNTWRAACTC